jgi:hypothetical protein
MENSDRNLDRSEKLFDEIGLIDEKFIHSAEPVQKNYRVTKIGFFSAQTALISAAALVLIAVTVLMLTMFRPEGHEHTPVTTEPPVTEPPKPAAVGDWTWIVEPNLPFRVISHCPWNDIFFSDVHLDGNDAYYYKLDETTGLLTDKRYQADNDISKLDFYNTIFWYYDPKLDLLGHYHTTYGENPMEFENFLEMHPRSEFTERFPGAADRIISATRVEKSVLEKYRNVPMQDASDPRYAESALLYNGEFISDFVYDGAGSSRRFSTMTVATQWNPTNNYKREIVDRYGNVLVPPDFEGLLLISENTAFARLDWGLDTYWGIIGFNGYEGDVMTDEPPTVTTAIPPVTFPPQSDEAEYGYQRHWFYLSESGYWGENEFTNRVVTFEVPDDWRGDGEYYDDGIAKLYVSPLTIEPILPHQEYDMKIDIGWGNLKTGTLEDMLSYIDSQITKEREYDISGVSDLIKLPNREIYYFTSWGNTIYNCFVYADGEFFVFPGYMFLRDAPEPKHIAVFNRIAESIRF